MADDTVLSPGTKQWQVKQRSWCVKRYLVTKSFVKIQGEFLHFFNTDRAPDKKRIQVWVAKFSEFGTAQNRNRKSDERGSHSGRKRVRDEPLIARIRSDVENSPKRSTRKRCQSLEIARTTLRRVLKDDLGKYPYRIQTKQKLTPADMKRREEMAVVLMDKIEENKTFLPYLFSSDEAHFHLDGQVNSKNNVFCVRLKKCKDLKGAHLEHLL